MPAAAAAAAAALTAAASDDALVRYPRNSECQDAQSLAAQSKCQLSPLQLPAPQHLSLYLFSAYQQDGVTTTLDGLRRGDAGEPIPRDSVPAASLFTNDFLP